MKNANINTCKTCLPFKTQMSLEWQKTHAYVFINRFNRSLRDDKMAKYKLQRRVYLIMFDMHVTCYIRACKVDAMCMSKQHALSSTILLEYA